MGGGSSKVAPSESAVADTTAKTEHVANPPQVLTMVQTTTHRRLTPTLTQTHPFTLKCLCLHTPTPQVNVAGSDKTTATVKRAITYQQTNKQIPTRAHTHTYSRLHSPSHLPVPSPPHSPSQSHAYSAFPSQSH